MPDRRFVLRSLLAAATAPLVPVPIGAQTTPPARIRIAITSADNFAEGYYAQDAGFFTKAGLDVEVVGMTTGAQISAAVAGGSIDIGMSNTVQLVNAMTHGAPFVIVAPAVSIPTPYRVRRWPSQRTRHFVLPATSKAKRAQ
jgi:ABC-type nitrate/sulfonate/bicarbonate transport system substrate-binding protein